MKEKLKVGDKVINNVMHSCFKGDEGIITKMSTDSFYIEYCKSYGEIYYFMSDLKNFKKVDSSELKIGDRLKHVQVTSGHTLGGIGTVIKIEGSWFHLKYDEYPYSLVYGEEAYPFKYLLSQVKDGEFIKLGGELLKEEKQNKKLKSMLINEINGDKMELKNIKKENLAEAKKQFEEERKNSEIEFAKKEYRRAIDCINDYDRQIKALNEKKVDYQEIIDKFNKK